MAHKLTQLHSLDGAALAPDGQTLRLPPMRRRRWSGTGTLACAQSSMHPLHRQGRVPVPHRYSASVVIRAQLDGGSAPWYYICEKLRGKHGVGDDGKRASSTIPKAIGQHLRLKPGDRVKFFVCPDGTGGAPLPNDPERFLDARSRIGCGNKKQVAGAIGRDRQPGLDADVLCEAQPIFLGPSAIPVPTRFISPISSSTSRTFLRAMAEVHRIAKPGAAGCGGHAALQLHAARLAPDPPLVQLGFHSFDYFVKEVLRISPTGQEVSGFSTGA